MTVHRYLVQYGVADSSGRSAPSLTLDITFLESGTITGSFLLIGQADSNSSAQQDALALSNSSSLVNTAFTAALASAFQSWLTHTTSAFANQLVDARFMSAADVSAIDSARLALLGDVLQPDVKVLNSSIDQTATALLVSNSTAAVQNYAYNVTVQVTVLTASLLSSVFVSLLNDTTNLINGGRLLHAHSAQEADMSGLQYSMLAAWSQQHVNNLVPTVTQQAGPTAADFAPVTTVYNMANNYSSLAYSSNMSSVSTMYSSSRSRRGSNTRRMTGMYNDSSSSTSSQYLNSSQYVDSSQCISSSDKVTSRQHLQEIQHLSSSHHVSGADLHAQGRRLQAPQPNSPFPLASLLLFKTDLILAAFNGTSSCSTDSIGDLFYGGSDLPADVAQVCQSSAGDGSLNHALLQLANSSLPLFQVFSCLHGTAASLLQGHFMLCCCHKWQRAAEPATHVPCVCRCCKCSQQPYNRKVSLWISRQA